MNTLVLLFLCTVFSIHPDQKILTVGHISDFPPFWYSNRGVDCTGLDCDFSKEVSKRLGFSQTNFRTYPSFNALYTGLKNNEIDVAINNLWASNRFPRDFYFSIPYYVKGGLGIMSYKNQLVNFESIKGKRVGGLSNTNYNYYDTRINDNLIIRFTTTSDLFNALINGQIDFAIEQFTLLKFYEKEKGLQGKTQSIFAKSLYATVVSTDRRLHNRINSAILSMWNDGSLFTIKDRYLSQIGIRAEQTFRVIFNCP